MSADVFDDVVRNEAADDALFVFGPEANQLHRPLQPRRVDDGLDGAPDGKHAAGQDMVGARAQPDLATQSLGRLLASAAPVLVRTLRG